MSTSNEHHGQSHGKGHGGNHFSPEVESLRNSFLELRKDVMKLLEDTKGTARNGVGAIRHAAASAAEGVKDRGEESVERLSKKIEDRPLAGTAIAFGVGFIIAKLMDRD